MTEPLRFPIQGGLTVSMEAAERAYKHYVRFFGASQALRRLAERGGFGLYEFTWLVQGKNPVGMKDPPEMRVVAALISGDVRPGGC